MLLLVRPGGSEVDTRNLQGYFCAVERRVGSPDFDRGADILERSEFIELTRPVILAVFLDLGWIYAVWLGTQGGYRGIHSRCA